MNTRIRTIFTSLLLSLVLIGSACAEESATGGTTTPPSTATTTVPSTVPSDGTTSEPTSTSPLDIQIAGFLFVDGDLEVDAGTTIRWTNQDRILHTVTSGTDEAPTGRFDLQLDGAGSTAQFTFDEPGTYEYFCSRHPHMTGTITVVAP